MPKTGVKKIESEDVAELSDEALDRAANQMGLCCCQGGPSAPPPSGYSAPSD
ncbi:MAG: hypothetical protein ISR48_03745 [Alphaproteobacteria bacterium]|nr:hypothetical protein [Alphaproteobacteria bacterium]